MAASAEGTFRLIDKASGTLDKITKRAALADKMLNKLGDTLDKLDAKLEGAGNRVDDLSGKLEVLSKIKATPKVELQGVPETLASLKAVQHELDVTDRKVGRRMGAAGGGGFFGKGGGFRAGAMAGGAGIKAMFSGISKWITLAPLALGVIVDLTGAVTALGASATAAVGGAGLIGGAGLSGLALGIGSLFAIGKTALGPLKDYSAAVKNLNKAMTTGDPRQIAKAQQQVDLLAKKSPGVARLSKNLTAVKDEWGKLSKPGQRNFLGMLGDGLDMVRKKLPLFAHEANKNAGAARKAFKTVLSVFDTKTFNAFFKQINSDFRKSLGPLSRGFKDIGLGVMRLFKLASPETVKMSKHFEQMAKHFDAWSKSSKAGKFVKDMIRSFHAWGGLLKSTLGLLKALFAPARGAGDSMVQSLTKTFDKWSEWLNKHPKETRKFFKDSVHDVSDMAKSLGGLVKNLWDIGRATRPLVGIMSALVGTLSGVPSLMGGGGVEDLALGFLGGKVGYKGFKAWSKARGGGGGGGLLGGGGGLKGAIGRALSRPDGTPTNPFYVVPVRGPLGGGGLPGGAAGGGPGGGRAGGKPGRFGLPRMPALDEPGSPLAAIGTGAAILGAIKVATDLHQPGITQTPGNRVRYASGEALKTVLGPYLGGLLGHLSSPASRTGVPDPDVMPEASLDYLLHGPPIKGTKPKNARQRYFEHNAPLRGVVATRGGQSPGLIGHGTINTHAFPVPGGLLDARGGLGGNTLKGLDAISSAFDKTGGHIGKSWSDSMANVDHVGRKGLTNANKGVDDKLGTVQGTFTTRLGNMQTSVSKAFQSIFGEMTSWLAKMTGGTGAVVNATTSVVTGMGGKPKKKGAKGLRIPGFGQSDTVPIAPGAMAAPGELIVNKHTENRIDRLLRTHGTSLGREVAGETVPHSTDLYARGGRARGPEGTGRTGSGTGRTGAGGNVNLYGHPSNIAPSLSRLIGVMERRFPGLAVSATTDGRHVAGSDHYTGHAVDLASGDYGYMDRAAAWINNSGLFRSLKQGIHNPNLSVNRGRHVDPSFFSAVWPGHRNHIHLAVEGALRAFSGGAGGPGITHTIARRILKGIGGAAGHFGQGALDRVRGAAQHKLDAAGGGGVGSTYHGPLNRDFGRGSKAQLSPGQVAQIASSVGLPGRLFAQIAHGESNYQPGAVSPDGGFGLWQITPRVHSPALRARWKAMGSFFNPVTNAKMAKVLYDQAGGTISPWFGTRYVTTAGRGTHALGGRVPEWGGWHGDGLNKTFDRPTYIGVGEKGKEHVKITPAGRDGGGIVVHKLVVHGSEDTKRQVKQAFHELARELDLQSAEVD